MANTNYNVPPYNDDFDESKKFYRVLFRPGVAVQARELTQSQTILQNQIERFGNHIFKHGAMVIPGHVALNANINYVRLQPTFGVAQPGNVPVPIDINLLIGKLIEGVTTGIQAYVVAGIPAEDIDPNTIYVNYLTEGDGGKTRFDPDEELRIVGTSQSLAKVDLLNPTGLSAVAQIADGVYYINGFFVKVDKQLIVLAKYDNIVSCRVGLNIVETVVTPEDDNSLTDNAANFYNYAAPGAHRLKIDLILQSRPYDDLDNTDFVELIRVKESSIEQVVEKTEYSILAEELARRTYETHGDYTIYPFPLEIHEHLDTSFVTKGVSPLGTPEIVNQNTGDVITPATIKLEIASASAVDDFYNGMTIRITDGPGAGQERIITDYFGGTKIAYLDSDWEANRVPSPESLVPNTTNNPSDYFIYDPTKVNRGIYPPAPFGPGDETKLAVGLGPGKAYVRGFELEKKATTYLDVPKSRSTTQTNNTSITQNSGPYMLVKNIVGIPNPPVSPLGADYLLITIHSTKANGTFDPNTIIGTARVKGLEWVTGTVGGDAYYKMFLFDIKLNTGATINDAQSYYLNTGGNNNNGYNCYGDIMTKYTLRNVNGSFTTGTLQAASSTYQETIYNFNAATNILLTEPTSAKTSINKAGTIFVTNTSGGATAQIASREIMFDAATAGVLIFPLPQNVIQTIRDKDNEIDTTYYTRRYFQASPVGGAGNTSYTFTSSDDAPFMPVNVIDYLACNASTGAVVPLTNVNVEFIGIPNPSTVLRLTFVGTMAYDLRLMATIQKEGNAAREKRKNLITTGVKTYPNPKPQMSLERADILRVKRVLDCQDANTPTENDIDITARYSVDNGQRDSYYDLGSITLQPGFAAPNGQVRIEFDYFEHTAGDYFSVDSYEQSTVAYKDIPVYVSQNTGTMYPLRDCLDFRPRVANIPLSDGTYVNYRQAGASMSDFVKPGTFIRADFRYYLSRIDKIFMTKNGEFKLLMGNPGVVPLPPENPKDGMHIYTIRLGPYTISEQDVIFRMIDNKRYTMRDIGKLERRIENLEYYTSLNELEKNTADLQITDTETGLNRFKQGFVIDNFKGHAVGDVFSVDYACSMDREIGEMRPLFTQDNTGLTFAPDQSSGYVANPQNNLNWQCITLPWTEEVLVDQPKTTFIENVNPFAIFGWAGSLELDPPTDEWRDTEQLPDVLQNDDRALDTLQFMSQRFRAMGTVWNEWQTDWLGQPTTTSTVERGPEIRETSFDFFVPIGFDANGRQTGGRPIRATTTTNSVTVQSGQRSRTGTVLTAVPEVIRTEISDRTVNVSIVPFIRNRIVKWTARRMKPNTRVYPFFDGIGVSQYVRPTINGTPQTWGAPIFTDGVGSATGDFDIPNNAQLKFRVGTRIFRLTSSEVNANVNALSNEFLGTVGVDEARAAVADTWAQADYQAQGILETRQKTITSVRSPRIVAQTVRESETFVQEVARSTRTTTEIVGWYDPLAETFLVTEKGGCFLTRVDIYFNTKDPNIPVTLQIRNVVNGYPGQKILAFGEKTLYPQTQSGAEAIYTSEDGSIPTSFIFDVPVYVEESGEYCFTILANSTEYTVFCARMGEREIGKTSIVSNQPYAGVMFKSQNNSTWTAYQNEDIKFKLYRAKFTTDQAGVTYFINQEPRRRVLDALPFQMEEGTNFVRVFHPDHGFTIGSNSRSVVTISNVTIRGEGVGATAGATVVSGVIDTITVNAGGSGYNAAPIVTITDTTGVGATATATVSAGAVTGITVTNGGSGYSNNPTITITPVGSFGAITNSMLMGDFDVVSVDSLDSYIIQVNANAPSSGRVGEAGVVVTQNRQYDILYPIVSQMVLPGTSIEWGLKTVTGGGPDRPVGTTEPYITDLDYTAVGVNQNIYMPYPRMIANPKSEAASVGQPNSPLLDKKSVVLKATMQTTQDNLSPVIDLKRMSLVTINNRIDDPSFANRTRQIMDLQTTIAATSGSNSVAFFAPDRIEIAKPNLANYDFTLLKPGRYITIVGASNTANNRAFGSPVRIITASKTTLIVDNNGTPFVNEGTSGAAGNYAGTGGNVQIDAFGRYVAEEAPVGCTGAARYITRKFTLLNPANSLRVYLTVNRQLGNEVALFYRTLKADTLDNFDDQPYIELPLKDGAGPSESANENEFKEYVYEANNLEEFVAFSVKIVMTGYNSSKVPRFRDFRAIALLS
jgi:hypothetical protein